MKYGYSVRDLSNQSYPEIRDLTIKIEALGFESIHITDHFFSSFDSREKKTPFLESITLLSALAIETERIKLGHVVLCNSFRNPAYLAKIISSLDHISNGRILMWLGAGWYEEEYEAYGYTFPSPKRRVDELEESLIIYKKIFTENETNFEGKFWNLKRHRSFPKPIQKPYPQIVIGTNGKRMIDIACREVDGINLPCLFPIYLKLMNSNISIINETLKKYNRDPSEFEISFFTDVIIVDNQERIERIRKEKKIPKSLMKFLFIGTPEIIREKIREVERLGVKKMVLYKLESPDLEDPLDIFKREIM